MISQQKLILISFPFTQPNHHFYHLQQFSTTLLVKYKKSNMTSFCAVTRALPASGSSGIISGRYDDKWKISWLDIFSQTSKILHATQTKKPGTTINGIFGRMRPELTRKWLSSLA
jgi:hypothetical protein